MAERKVIAVLGATGAQGGGLVRAILADGQGEFSVRAITRDAGSDKAKELAALGAQVVAADVDDERSLESAFARRARRLLRHLLLGALLAGEGDRAGAQPWRARRRRPA